MIQETRMMMNVLFVNFLDDKYFSDVFSEVGKALHQENMKCLPMCWKKNMGCNEGVYTDELVSLSRLRKVAPKNIHHLIPRVEWQFFNEAKVYFFNSIDRVHLKAKPIKYYNEYFKYLILYFTYLVRFKNIKVLLYESSPHMPWDIVSFFVAKNEKISTLIVRRTIFENISIISDDFRSGKSLIFSAESPLDLSLLSRKSMTPKITQRSKEKNIDSIRAGSDSYLSAFKSSACLLFALMGVLRKRREIDYFFVNRVEEMCFSLKRGIRRIQAKKKYKSLSSDVDLDINYVYFALHFRPERSTVPEGGYFSSQFEAIKVIRSALSDDIAIFVKEHPRQFSDLSPNLRYLHISQRGLYQEITMLPNVYLVPWDWSSEDLIKNCLMTFSITGSTVWEGLEIGKPGCTFGNVWHSDCVSSPDLSYAKDAESIIFKLLSKKKEDVESDVQEFLRLFKQKMFQGSNSFLIASETCDDYPKLVKTMANELAIKCVK